MPAVGYDHPDQSHFVSRHFYEVGALDPQTTTGWLGRYLDRVGSPENPLQGLALDNSLAPALAAGRVPVAAIDNPTDYNFWARDVWGDIEPLMLDATARIGVVHQRSERALAQVGGAAMHTGALRWQLAGLREVDGQRAVHAAGRLSHLGGLGLPRAARRAGRDARRRAAAALRGDHRARRLRHAREPGRDARRAAHARLRGARRVPARPRGARARRPRAGPRLVGVRPPRRGEQRGHRPRRRRARAADRDARGGPDDRRVPRPRRARRPREPARDVGLPRRSTPACSSSGSAPRRTGSSPTRRASRGRSWSSDRRGARRRAGAGRSPAPARMLVTADEWLLVSSRQSVAAGQVEIQLYNRGEDGHDLAAPAGSAAGGRCGSRRPGPGSSARRRGG